MRALTVDAAVKVINSIKQGLMLLVNNFNPHTKSLIPSDYFQSNFALKIRNSLTFVVYV
jgi:hypothetical protein